MNKRSLFQAFALMLLAIALLAATVIWQRHWQPRISEKERQTLESLLIATLDDAVDFQKLDLLSAEPAIERSGPSNLMDAYRARDGHGKTAGYIIRFKGPGHQDAIEGLLVLDATVRKIVRLTITEAKESPQKDLFERSPERLRFQGVFCGKPVRLALPWDEGIHAITGASISSKIIVRYMNECITALKAYLQSETKQTGRTG
ncbi:MAG: FMN-binding protein [Planctomycetota bacterium]|jgi:Na+-translocating ferredoxin:NAD+ oxidoreductase RnfG subunit|nr:FMN-binding protein [Planctomycetota bacterium]MDP6504487.1 FMN-binding protein [Planctomycetota bacterium]